MLLTSDSNVIFVILFAENDFPQIGLQPMQYFILYLFYSQDYELKCSAKRFLQTPAYRDTKLL